MSEQTLNNVVDEAAHWMMRLQSGDIGENERQAFIVWQNAPPTPAQVNLDLARDFQLSWMPYPLSVASGADYLHQNYELEAGEAGSYYRGGSSGLAGFRAADAGDWSRHNLAPYLDLETNLTEQFGVSAAPRHEDYSDFGSNISGSLAGRYDFTPQVALRGSVSTGFRAPSLAQQHFAQTSSPLIGSTIQEAGTFPADSQVARLLGDTAPRHKLTFGNDLSLGNWTLRSNLVRHGTFTSHQNNATNDQTFDAAWVLDLAADHALDNWLFTLGGDNVTDERPERLLAANSSGGNLKYSTFSPYGYSGAFYHGKVSYGW